MSEQTHNNQLITQYLLGLLPETETEHFDELSIRDDEFAGALKAAENDLVDAYAQGELTGRELERFRSYYLASPLRREKVGFAEGLQEWAQKNATAQAEPLRTEGRQKQGRTAWFPARRVFSVPRVAVQWGTALAALVLLVAGGWLMIENTRLRQQISQTHGSSNVPGDREQELQKELQRQRSTNAKTVEELAKAREDRERLEQELKKVQEQREARQPRSSPPSGVSIASFILAPQMRGASDVRTISIPAETDYVAMGLDLEPNSYSAYRVALLDQSDNRTLWRGSNLKPRTKGDTKTLDIKFSARILKPRVYVLRVTGVAADGAGEVIGDYPFRVVE